jgi:hypothetical protein
MKAAHFIKAVDNLVREWASEEPIPGAIPRETLTQIFDQVREEAVHELAEAIRQRDEAMKRLHRKYVQPKPKEKSR